MTAFLFEWDPVKAEANRRKHGIRFEDAVEVFEDPLRRTTQDRVEGGEYRWQTLGLVDGVTVLLVAHADWEGDHGDMVIVRMISARKATRAERRQYENEDG